MQYLAQQMGGVSPDAAARLMFAAARNSAQRNMDGSYLSNEQQHKAGKLGVSAQDMYKGRARWEKGDWVGKDGGKFIPVDYTLGWRTKPNGPVGTKSGSGSDGNVQDPTNPNEPGNETAVGVPPQRGITNRGGGTGTIDPRTGVPSRGSTVPPTPTGGIIPDRSQLPVTQPPVTQPPVTQPPVGGAPRNPVTTPPAPPTPGPTGPAPYQPQPMRAFDPTYMLMALRQSSNYGQNRGVSPAQHALGDYLSVSMLNRGQPGTGNG